MGEFNDYGLIIVAIKGLEKVRDEMFAANKTELVDKAHRKAVKSAVALLDSALYSND